MEPKVIQYLKRIIKTISIGLLWMIINTRLGITSNYAFIEGNIKISNIFFYMWFLISLVAMLFYFYKIWKTDLNFNEE
jgi:hypothetical protein